MKSRLLENHQKRVEILQHGESRIQAATNVEQFKAYHQQEHRSHEQLREQLERDRNAIREQHEDKKGK